MRLVFRVSRGWWLVVSDVIANTFADLIGGTSR
jgi:hypothetical protein